MATYKVPQDVEADDKLLGPFTFRQFIYLMIVFGMVVLAIALFQVFPLLAIIPIPIGLFFAILALPLKKDQPMETYLAAIVSFYLKSKKRLWMPGQSDSTIKITAPKKVEASRTRNITEAEANHRLSFLAAVVDSEGQAIKSANSPMRDEFYAEAYNTTDMFDQYGTTNLSRLITKEQQERHEAVVNQMRAAIQTSAYNYDEPAPAPAPEPRPGERVLQPTATPISSAVVTPTINTTTSTLNPAAAAAPLVPADQPTPASTTERLDELAHNPDFSVETIGQQADRIRRENDNEVYVSLH